MEHPATAAPQQRAETKTPRPARLGLLRAAIVSAVVILGPGSASALAFTLSSPVGFSQGGVSGTVSPDFTTSGSVLCLDPTSGCADTDFIVFRVSVTSGTVDEVGASALVAAAITGVGAFDTSDVTPSGGAIVLGTQARFDFDSPNVGAGDATDALFVSYGGGTLSGGESASFSIQPAGGTIFSVSGTLVLVPEPATLVLLGGALLGLAALGRGQRA